MATVGLSSNYDETLKSMKTGKDKDGPINTFKRFINWDDATEVLPNNNNNGSGVLSWPPWSTSPAPVAPWYDTFGMTLVQRYSAFALCLLGAILLFSLAMFRLPALVIWPSKFVVPYCLGNMMIFISFGFLQGFYSYLTHLFSPGRWPYTGAFLGSTMLTLYVAMVLKMYILTIPMALVQFGAMLVYIVSYLPGGSGSISTFASLASARFFGF
jgi:hypothetical protein